MKKDASAFKAAQKRTMANKVKNYSEIKIFRKRALLNSKRIK